MQLYSNSSKLWQVNLKVRNQFITNTYVSNNKYTACVARYKFEVVWLYRALYSWYNTHHSYIIHHEKSAKNRITFNIAKLILFLLLKLLHGINFSWKHKTLLEFLNIRTIALSWDYSLHSIDDMINWNLSTEYKHQHIEVIYLSIWLPPRIGATFEKPHVTIWFSYASKSERVKLWAWNWFSIFKVFGSLIVI